MEQNGKRINYDRIKELYSNIVKNGVWLAGGGSLLRGIARRFGDKVNIPFHVAEDPLKAVARGTAYVTVRTYNGKESTCKITVK